MGTGAWFPDRGDVTGPAEGRVRHVPRPGRVPRLLHGQPRVGGIGSGPADDRLYRVDACEGHAGDLRAPLVRLRNLVTR